MSDDAMPVVTDTSFKLRSLWFFVLSLLSVGMVNLCGLFWVGQTDVKPIEQQVSEQLAMPAVMPYDVEVTEPWGGLAVRIVYGGLVALSALLLLWQARKIMTTSKANHPATADRNMVLRRQVGAIIVFWVVGCVILAVESQVVRAASHGIPPYG